MAFHGEVWNALMEDVLLHKVILVPLSYKRTCSNISMSSRTPQHTNGADDRTVEALVLSPDGQLAACTDDKGRVLLLDTGNLCFVRSWKGYRDAQCAWLEGATLEPNVQHGELGFWNAQAESRREPSGACDLNDRRESVAQAPEASDCPLAPLERCVKLD
jgi:hypothetical protein